MLYGAARITSLPCGFKRMTLKENILRKISIKKAAAALEFMLPGSFVKKFDKKAAVFLLESAGYRYEKVRDLELYCQGIDSENRKIIVLDHDLPLYMTSIEDVALRKSPNIKEMLSFSGIRKILWDENVVIKKKADTVEAILDEALLRLDLSVTENGVDEIMYSALASFEEKYIEGVMEGFMIFSELLEWTYPYGNRPDEFIISGFFIQDSINGNLYGPVMLYNLSKNQLFLTEKTFLLSDLENKEDFKKSALGMEGDFLSGEAVLRRLCHIVKLKYKLIKQD